MPTYSCSSSPFSHVLDTNYAPSEEEYANIRSLLYEPEQRAATLAQEIQKLQAELDEVQHFIDRHCSLLSPVRRVPADILGEIFVQALPSNTLNLAVRAVKDAPLLLTTICHSWREVALKTPRLWNGIHIYLPRNLPEFSDDQLSFLIQQRKQGVQTWLDRSGALPITFFISVAADWGRGPFGHESPEPPESGDYANFAALLTKYSRRLGAVKISFEPPENGLPISSSVWQSFTDLTREDLPILQDVQLSGHLFTYHDPQGGLLTTPTPTSLGLLLPKLSSLRTLHISHESAEAVLSLGLRWTFITHLTLKSRSNDPANASVVATIVKSCPSLLSLSLDITFNYFSPEIADSTVVSTVPPQRTNLRSLALRLRERDRLERTVFNPSHALSATFLGISTPAREDLTIASESHHYLDTVSGSHEGSHMPFYETSARSNCRITHLVANGFLLANPKALLRSSELLESLVSLKCEDNPANGSSFYQDQPDNDYLTPFLRLLAENTSLCPHLERIQMDCEVRHVDAVITFASSRHRLKYLAADFGLLVAKGESEDVSSERVQAVVAEWRQARGIQVVWKWLNTPINPGFLDRPCKGIPGERTLWKHTPPQRGYL
ncbi:hypothetical protein V5O48_012100 [Marasmius crinis-equi]|uniref:F-box domain-containing protein n=1 Tax=Marasmius crinis-equi TaxID=585013 RepID=A0ABR3F3P9_9AGAR